MYNGNNLKLCLYFEEIQATYALKGYAYKKNSYEEFLRINKFAGNYNRKNRDLFLANLSLVRKILLRILLILKTRVIINFKRFLCNIHVVVCEIPAASVESTKDWILNLN